jgi:parallel beta-helix repeat protein
VTVSSVHGNLDTRAKVGHISRNIKILAGPDSGWGFSIYIYGYTDTANVQRVGSAQLVGVQILNGGQLDSRNSPLVFKNLVGGNLTSKVSKSSFVNCKAFCINVDTANNITITSNVLTNAWVFGVQITAMKYFTFTNNVIIGVTGRPTVDAFAELVACFSALLPVDAANDYVKVTDNVCQGSVSHGWAVPHIGCGDL